MVKATFIVNGHHLFNGFNEAIRSCKFKFEFQAGQKVNLSLHNVPWSVLVSCCLDGKSNWIFERLIELYLTLRLPWLPALCWQCLAAGAWSSARCSASSATCPGIIWPDIWWSCGTQCPPYAKISPGKNEEKLRGGINFWAYGFGLPRSSSWATGYKKPQAMVAVCHLIAWWSESDGWLTLSATSVSWSSSIDSLVSIVVAGSLWNIIIFFAKSLTFTGHDSIVENYRQWIITSK